MHYPTKHLPTLILATVSLMTPVVSTAVAIDVRVHNQHDEPVESAVVTLRPLDGDIATRPITAVMDQRGRKFLPQILVVSTGSSVTFPNSDQIRHHVYSFSKARQFDLKLYSSAQTPSVTFDVPGVVTLGCNIHDWMRGYIYVTGDPYFKTTNAEGHAKFFGLVAGRYRYTVWHPRLPRDQPTVGDAVSLPAGGDLSIGVDLEIRLPLLEQEPRDGSGGDYGY